MINGGSSFHDITKICPKFLALRISHILSNLLSCAGRVPIPSMLSMSAGFEGVKESNAMARVTNRDAKASTSPSRGVFLDNNTSFDV